MGEKVSDTGRSKQLESIDTSRRKMLRKMGKAAYVAPVLTLLSFGANSQIGPPPPPPFPISCPGGEPPPCVEGDSSDSSTTSNRQRKRRKRGGD